MEPITSELIRVSGWLRSGPRIEGRPVRCGTAYTYMTDDGEINITNATVRDFTHHEIKRMAIIQGKIKICEIETMLLTHVSGRVINWGVWDPYLE